MSDEAERSEGVSSLGVERRATSNDSGSISDSINSENNKISTTSEPASSQSNSERQEVESEEVDSYLPEGENLEKMILSTGIRVGTPVKTKYMTPFIVRANPEGLYILDISKTLSRIDVAAKFIGRSSISKVAVTSAREYGKTPVEKFCELTEATSVFGRFMPGTFTNPSLPKYMEPEIVIVTRSEEHTSELQSRQYLVCSL